MIRLIVNYTQVELQGSHHRVYTERVHIATFDKVEDISMLAIGTQIEEEQERTVYHIKEVRQITG